MMDGIPQDAIGHEERATLSDICCSINWVPVDSALVLVALTPHDSATNAFRRSKLQDFRHDYNFYTQMEWQYLVNPQVAAQSKLDCMLTKKLILGCRNPDEHSKKMWASFYLVVTRDQDALSQVSVAERNTVKRHIALSFLQRVKNFPDPGIGTCLPKTPAVLKEQHPVLYRRVFPDSHEPIEPLLNIELLHFFDDTWKCRGASSHGTGHSLQLESSSPVGGLKEILGMFMNTVQTMQGNQQNMLERFSAPTGSHSCPTGLKSIQSLAALADRSALHRQSALEQPSSLAAQQSPLEQQSFFPALADKAAPHEQSHLHSSLVIESQPESQDYNAPMFANAPEPPMRTHVNFRPAASADSTVAPGAMVASGAIVAARSPDSTVALRAMVASGAIVAASEPDSTVAPGAVAESLAIVAASSPDSTVAPSAMVASGATVAASSPGSKVAPGTMVAAGASTVHVAPTTMMERQNMMIDAWDEREDEKEEIRKQKQKEKREADRAKKAAEKAAEKEGDKAKKAAEKVAEKAELQRQKEAEKAELQRQKHGQKEAVKEAAKANSAAEKATPKPLVDRAAGAVVPEGVQSAGDRAAGAAVPEGVQSAGGRERKRKNPDDAALETPAKQSAKHQKACVSHEISRKQYLLRKGSAGQSETFSYKTGVYTQVEAHNAAKDIFIIII